MIIINELDSESDTMLFLPTPAARSQKYSRTAPSALGAPASVDLAEHPIVACRVLILIKRKTKFGQSYNRHNINTKKHTHNPHSNTAISQ